MYNICIVYTNQRTLIISKYIIKNQGKLIKLKSTEITQTKHCLLAPSCVSEVQQFFLQSYLCRQIYKLITKLFKTSNTWARHLIYSLFIKISPDACITRYLEEMKCLYCVSKTYRKTLMMAVKWKMSFRPSMGNLILYSYIKKWIGNY